jgi:hypothetical protein
MDLKTHRFRGARAKHIEKISVAFPKTPPPRRMLIKNLVKIDLAMLQSWYLKYLHDWVYSDILNFGWFCDVIPPNYLKPSSSSKLLRKATGVAQQSHPEWLHSPPGASSLLVSCQPRSNQWTWRKLDRKQWFPPPYISISIYLYIQLYRVSSQLVPHKKENKSR